jgi:hypothetical protein
MAALAVYRIHPTLNMLLMSYVASTAAGRHIAGRTSDTIAGWFQRVQPSGGLPGTLRARES